MTSTQPMGQFQAIPWVGGSRMLFLIGERRYHPVNGNQIGVEGVALRELQPPTTHPAACPHNLGLNCLKCWPVQYGRTNARMP